MGIFEYPNIFYIIKYYIIFYYIFYIRIYFIGPITFQDGGSGYQTNKRQTVNTDHIPTETRRLRIIELFESQIDPEAENNKTV